MALLRRLRRKPRADTAGTGSALLPAKKKKRIWHSYETDNCKKRALQSNASFTAALSGARNLYWTTIPHPHSQLLAAFSSYFVILCCLG